MEMDAEKLKKELIEELSLGGMSPEKQDELLDEMVGTLLERIFVDTMEKIGKEGMDEYEKLLKEKASGEEIARFLESKISDYDAFVGEIVEKFKTGLKAVAH